MELTNIVSLINNYYKEIYNDFKAKSIVLDDEIIIYVNKSELVYDLDVLISHEHFMIELYRCIDLFENNSEKKIYIQYNFDDFFKE